jgi:hypothetical protein
MGIILFATVIVVFLAILLSKKQTTRESSPPNVDSAPEKTPIVRQRTPDVGVFKDKLTIHADIKDLLWFGDGPYKNLTEDQMMSDKDVFYLAGIYKVTIGKYYGAEPSIIYVDLPIIRPADESVIPRPPYFPKYRELTPEQRYIYLKLLYYPYNTNIDIGYVFILYYGLERHLLHGNFDAAFRAILKLRDVHKNKSFQYYSGNAIILSALLREKGEYALEFIKSLDKEYEFGFSDNLFLLCYYSFDYPLLPKDIIRMAKTFEFTNTNYIKKNPDIFLECLKEAIFENNGIESVNIKKYITDAELAKLKTTETTIFANSSIIGNTIEIPLLIDNFRLKKALNFLLETAHANTKTKVAELRKTGKLPTAPTVKNTVKKLPLPPIDEEYLHDPPKNMNIKKLHYFYEEQIEELFKRRYESPDYFERTIRACENQISIAKKAAHIVAEKEKVYTLKSGEEREQVFKEMLDGIDTSADKYKGLKLPKDFNPHIHKGLDSFEIRYWMTPHTGYKRLCMIREKQGDYEAVLQLATQAKEEGWLGDWNERIERAKKKITASTSKDIPEAVAEEAPAGDTEN